MIRFWQFVVYALQRVSEANLWRKSAEGSSQTCIQTARFESCSSSILAADTIARVWQHMQENDLVAESIELKILKANDPKTLRAYCSQRKDKSK